MRSGLFLKHRSVRDADPEDQRAFDAAFTETRHLAPRQRAVARGEPLDRALLLLDGLVARVMDDQKGERQIVGLHVPGDFVDLHGFPLGYIDHDVIAMTAVTVAMMPHAHLRRLVATRPALTTALWASTLLDAATHREWIFRIGRLDAAGRISHMFCELEARLRAVGLSDGRRFALALSQIDIAQACGLTPVHVNRTLRSLREDGLLLFRNGEAELLDAERLRQIAEFNPLYLYLDSASLAAAGD
ncbi:Crp/Fnr family transcriptional regulator [Sphingomonas morindae]|uniref:Crp/Fnr family transcriptional regulator n=1 Tax=Sphingomonas morindae TaxID=1541170 RepID=A0ABY4XA41_9SPHN|nr:Crp/Fnr family transcriptional regulator [Sphingomonas morindae]USI73842.1 Crp/Fnr family transcriptional regulator [Sphingomonas morindae]